MKLNAQVSRFAAPLVVVFAFMIMAAMSSHAAMISWEAPVVHTGATSGIVVSNEGTLLNAVNLGGVTNPTINGVTFTGGQSVGSLTYANTTATGGAPVTADSGLNDLWSTIAFTSGNNTNSATLSGLTAGNFYLVQFFGDHIGRTVTIGDGEVAPSTVALNNSSAIGRFVADSATQALTFANSAGSQHLNGFQLRELEDAPLFANEPFRVDVDSTQGGTSIETQTGFASLVISDAGDGSDTFATTYGNVTISVDGAGARNRADNAADPLSDLNEDFSFAATANGALVVTLDGLDEGEYQLTTHHMDDCCGGAVSGNFFDITVTDALGTNLLIDNADWSFVGETFTVLSDGLNPITIQIQEQNGSNRTRFNGIQIQSTAPLVPEPTTAMLAMLGMGGLAMRRRRASVNS